jgi:hypothetical protein
LGVDIGQANIQTNISRESGRIMQTLIEYSLGIDIGVDIA